MAGDSPLVAATPSTAFASLYGAGALSYYERASLFMRGSLQKRFPLPPPLRFCVQRYSVPHRNSVRPQRLHPAQALVS
jgi:hypothetical protein